MSRCDVVWSGVFSYLVVVYQVENQVYVSVYGLVLSQLRFHSVQPVNESLESVCKLAREQQGLLKLVLSVGEHPLWMDYGCIQNLTANSVIDS